MSKKKKSKGPWQAFADHLASNGIAVARAPSNGMSPLPYASGKGPTGDPSTTSWARSDGVTNDPAAIPSGVDGLNQRERIAEIGRIRDEEEAEQDDVRKAELRARRGELETFERLRKDAAQRFGNGGDISAEQENALVRGSGDLQALQRAMGADGRSKKNPKGRKLSVPSPNGGDLGFDLADDSKHIKRLTKQLNAAVDPLEKERLGHELTLRRLRALHQVAGPAPRAMTPQPLRVAKSAVNRLGELRKQAGIIDAAIAGADYSDRLQLEALRDRLADQIQLESLKAARHRR